MFKSIACSRLGRFEAAAEDLEQVSGYVDPEAPADDLRGFAAVAYKSTTVMHSQDSGRFEESIAALRLATQYVRPDDSSEMRHTAAGALMTTGEILSKLENHSEAMGAWDQVTEYVRTEDPAELRNVAVYTLNNKLRRAVARGSCRRRDAGQRREGSNRGSRIDG